MSAAHHIHTTTEPVAPSVPGVVPPLESECAAIWPSKVPTTTEPGFWLLGAHGGAGVSTLAQWIGPAGDSDRAWPSSTSQSPFVVIVASESIDGLAHAHTLLRQHAAGMTGPVARVLGVITVAPVPGKRPANLRHARDLLAGLADNLWEVPFIPHLREVAIDKLPTWSPGDEPTTKRRPKPTEAVPPSVARIAPDLIAATRHALKTQ